jgi:alcohol dehydrogenase
VLIVTDPGIVGAGHVARAETSLREAGIDVAVFDDVVENPTTSVVESCVVRARAHGTDLLVGLGGGSSLDTAKGCNFLLTNGGRMEDYWGVGKATRPMLPLVAVPTTAGTGSECQSFALICQEHTHAKMACGDRKAAPKVAILDPELTLTQPPPVAASTGIDALAHAVESAVSRKRTLLSQMFSREAFRLCWEGLPKVFENPDDVDARGKLLLGAALAGMAIENSMLGAAHAAANPLTARFGVIHGHAVGLMLPAVVRFNGEHPPARGAYQELALASGMVGHGGDPSSAASALADRIEALTETLGLPRRLSEVGGSPEPGVGRLAQEAAGQWTAGFNPRRVTAEDFVRLYETVSGD